VEVHQRSVAPLSAAVFCERLGGTDKTLAKLETGDGGVRLETLAMALMVLGELHRLGELLDSAKDDTGLSLEQARLPERIVNRRRRHRKALANPGSDLTRLMMTGASSDTDRVRGHGERAGPGQFETDARRALLMG
jgi:hypothetical protein